MMNNQNESAYIDYDIKQEIYKEKCLNDYIREDIRQEEDSIPVQVGTIHQVETFHYFLISDLYKR